MKERWCSACGQKFVPRAQCPRQSYCAQAACQKARKLLWQTTKRRSDHDYYENQAKANKAWMQRNPHYWTIHRSLREERSLNELMSLLVAGLQQMLDTSSTKTSRRGQPSLAFVVHFPIGKSQPLAVKLRVEVKTPDQKSSPTRRQETT